MKRILHETMAALALVLTLGACTEEEVLDTMRITLEKESYTVAPLGNVEIPFEVKNAGGPVTAAVSATEPGYAFTALMSGRNTGTVLFVAPDVVTEPVTLDVTLTVTGDDGRRTATTAFTIAVTGSDGLSVAFEKTEYDLIADAGQKLTLLYDVAGLGYASVDRTDVTAAGGWTAEAGNGAVTLTVPDRGRQTEVSLTVTDNYGRSASATAAVSLRQITRLTARANCHLAAPGSLIRFDASHRGNSDAEEDRLESVSAELLWQDANGLIEAVDYDPDSRTVLVSIARQSGNAVVATRGADGQIDWSWHIWVTDYDPKADALQVRNDTNAQMSWVYMNRDLGATTDDWQSMEFMGLYYQWGRKDPFPRLADHTTFEARPVYDLDGNEVAIGHAYVQTTDNLRNAIRNPTTFYGNENNNVGDWYTTTLSTHNNDLWGGSATTHRKTVYDPCPAGWRVPENDYLSQGLPAIKTYCGYFTQMTDAVDAERYAHDYYVALFDLETHQWYFPYAGRMNSQTGKISIADSFACYWTANHYKTASAYGAYYFTLNTFIGTGGKANTYEKRACGHSVRCVLDEAAAE